MQRQDQLPAQASSWSFSQLIYDVSSFVGAFFRPVIAIPEIQRSEASKELLWRNATPNLVIMGVAFAYPYIKDAVLITTGENPYLESALNVTALTVAGLSTVYQIHHNMGVYYELSERVKVENDLARRQSKKASLIKRVKKPDRKENERAKCENESNKLSAASNGVYYLGEKLSIYNYEAWKHYFLHLAGTGSHYFLYANKSVEYVARFADTLINGQSLIQYKTGSHTTCCYQHQQEELIKNNPYALGMGASYSFCVELLYNAYLFIGYDNFLFHFALSNLVYQWHLSSLLVKKDSLPGKTKGIDFFYPTRNIIDLNMGMLLECIKPGIDWLQQLFDQPSEEDIYEQVMRFFNTLAGHYVAKFLYFYISTPSVAFFFKTHRTHFEEIYSALEKVRAGFDDEDGRINKLKYNLAIKFDLASPLEIKVLKFLKSSDGPPTLKLLNKALSKLYTDRDNRDLALDRQQAGRRKLLEIDKADSHPEAAGELQLTEAQKLALSM